MCVCYCGNIKITIFIKSRYFTNILTRLIMALLANVDLKLNSQSYTEK